MRVDVLARQSIARGAVGWRDDTLTGVREGSGQK